MSEDELFELSSSFILVLKDLIPFAISAIKVGILPFPNNNRTIIRTMIQCQILNAPIPFYTIIWKNYLGKINTCDWSKVIESEDAGLGKKLPITLLCIWCLLLFLSLTVICTMALFPKNFESTTTPV